MRNYMTFLHMHSTGRPMYIDHNQWCLWVDLPEYSIRFLHYSDNAPPNIIVSIITDTGVKLHIIKKVKGATSYVGTTDALLPCTPIKEFHIELTTGEVLEGKLAGTVETLEVVP